VGLLRIASIFSESIWLSPLIVALLLLLPGLACSSANRKMRKEITDTQAGKKEEEKRII